ncbi:MAG: hypothetical protein ABIT36_02490 [Steroidobacteraceae bacterium]
MSKRVATWHLLLALLSVSVGTAAAQAVTETGMRTGPAVWIEEYWDVKPDKVDTFFKTYKAEVYPLTRKLPGYRGYTVLTNIPKDGFPNAVENPDALFQPHYGITINRKVLTEQVIDIGLMMRKTHNVIVVHYFRNWSDADAFRPGLDKAYATNKGGAKLADHLAKTLYPLANNMWETRFRLIETGLELSAQQTRGNDADGFNLEPKPPTTGWYKEYFDVPADKLDEWVKVYKDNTLKVMAPIKGYEGVSLVTTLPPKSAEAIRTKYTNQTLGGPADFLVPFPGVMMNGTIRTDTSVNYSALYKPTFTVITYYQFPKGVKMLEEMQNNFNKDHPGEDRIKHITKVFFSLSKNHWDMWYRPIESSFAPTSK